MNNELTTIDDNDALLGSVVQNRTEVSTAIQLASALIDKRIATARQWPRSVSTFKKEASTLIREDLELARSAEYAKPVGGGTVRGPSIRLLEIASLCWRNLDDGMVEAVVEDKSVRVTWYAYDLERNLRSEGYSSTSIMGRNGRYAQHLIETTVLATASKARRNALEKVIPKAFVKDLLAIAKEVAAGNKEPLDVSRQKTLDYFARTHKVQPEQVFAMLGIAGLEDITEEHLDELRPIATALKEGHAKPEEFFQTQAESKLDAVKEKIADRKAKADAKGKQSKAFAEPEGMEALAK